MEEYYKAIKYLESLGNIGAGYQKTNLTAHPNPNIFLERMQDFLNLIGNPEKGFKYVHITGTSGKGSVSNLVHGMIVKNKKRVGLFTSPFTVSTIEKIQVGEKYIDPKAFVKITEGLKPAIDKSLLEGRHGIPSYFELMLAIALVYFKQEKCEYVVLEVGLGGRYDATNIIKNPLVTAITNIGLDHTNILGPRREDIANDKSGIIKKGSAFFTTETTPKILSILKKACDDVGATYTALKVEEADHRVQNILLATSIVKSLGLKVEGTFSANLPARFEIVEKDPYVIIDGAHNPSKIESTFENLNRLKYKKLHVVLAVSADKDWKNIVKQIAQNCDSLYLTRFNVAGRNSTNPAELYKEALKYIKNKKNLAVFSDPVQAFTKAQDKAGESDVVLVVGSFYLAGDIRSLYCPESKILKQRNSKI